MTKEQLQDLLKGDRSKAVEALSRLPKRRISKYAQTAANITPLEEYNVEDHPIFDKSKRPDKEGDRKPGEREVNRIGLAIEAYIASRAAAFLCGLPIKYLATPDNEEEEKMWAAFQRVNEANKLDYKNQGILEMRMSELRVAEIWYMQPLEDGDDFWQGTEVKSTEAPRLFLAAKSLLDDIYPIWNNQILIGLVRRWTEVGDDGKDILHFDVYMSDEIVEWVQSGSDWEDSKNTTAPDDTGKLNVIYHTQEDTEWHRVTTIIRRLEALYSNFADSNDRSAFPVLGIYGDVEGLPQGVADKAMKFKNGAKAEYITPANAPEAVKAEIEYLWQELHKLSDTVDNSNNALKALGQTTGPALEFRFLPAHIKASKHRGTFGECIQRRVNLIKTMIVSCDESLKPGLSLQIRPQFDYFLPKDITGITNYLSTATQSGILSKETGAALLQDALGGDSRAEWERIQAEPQADPLETALEDAA